MTRPENPHNLDPAWTDAASDGLPSPQDDDPASLRADILDELGDHLTCATARESKRHPEASAVRRAVLARFGDPRRVAWRLWLDANKERIMNQRLTLAAVGVLTAAVVTLCLLTWTMFQQGREVNAAILAKLETLTAGPEQTTDPLEWTELTVRCVEGTEDGRPAEGFKVRLEGKAINISEDITVQRTVDSSGEVRFSPIRPGAYKMYISAPWGAYSDQKTVVFPGSGHTELVICPKEEAPKKTQVTFDMQWPADLQEARLAARLYFSWRGTGFELEGNSWQNSYGDAGIEAILTNDGKLLNADFKMTADRSVAARIARKRISPTRGHVIYPYRKEDFQEEPTRNVIVGPYSLGINEIYTVENVPSDPSTRGMRSLLSSDRESRLTSFGSRKVLGWRRQMVVLRASAEEQNQWKIELPESLVEEIRAALSEVDEEPNS